MQAHTVKGLGRLALALGLDQAGIKKDKIRRLADYHDGSPQQADDLLRRLKSEKDVQKLEKTKKWADGAARWMMEDEIPGIEENLNVTIAEIKGEADESIAKAEAKAAESIAKAVAKADAKIFEARRQMEDEIQTSDNAKQQLADMGYSCN